MSEVIGDKKVVAIDYKLTIAGGIVVDASDKGAPLYYLHGADNIIPGLERELVGLSVGDKKTVVVQPEDGYGVYEKEKVRQVPKSNFPEGTTFEVGDRVTAHAPDGSELPARIKAMDNKEVTLDFNSELAGKVLTFEIQVAEVRDASKEELGHGHVHGPGGHHH